jgi:2-polyprenyl-3-methyl-5-hydroxy-6-metoxy-1,4-benzoquinol methylase
MEKLTDPIEELYSSKDVGYFSLERQIFKNAIPENGLRILDIGCGNGVLGAYFRNEQKCEVFGIDINENACMEAQKNLDGVLHANVEVIDLPYETEYFDTIIMGDVVEHLINPVIALKKLLLVLKPGGKIFITVPNIRNWKEVCNLVFHDKWEYDTWGILDYTHLRFFTKTSIVSMLQKGQINVIDAQWVIQQPSKSNIINKLSFGLFEGFLASHTFLIVQK